MRRGAAALRWGRTFLRAEISVYDARPVSRDPRFNGAARFCVRKSDDMSDGGGAYRQLQWGRTFLRAEISLRAAHLENDAMASMGPHVFACGNGESTCLIESEEACFNGAARFCVRKYGSAHPGFFTVVVLQWGRTFLRAEISR